MDKVRMGIIGIGNMGSVHAKNLAEGQVPGMEVAAIADINPARIVWAKENLPETVACFDNATAMMKSGKIDAVIIAVPHYFHPPLAIEAFENGLHVMCEKPAGVYTAAVREMNAAAKRSGKAFGIMFNQRTNCLYRKMRELVQGGDMGSIRRTNWIITDWYRSQSYYDSGAWRATWSGEGGGVLLNQCPHNLDLWQWICGMPTSVRAFAQVGKWHDIEVEDDVTAYVEYANGATGVFITSTGDTPGTNRFEVTMDGGKIVCEQNKLMLYKLAVSEPEFSRTWTKGFGSPECVISEVETDGENLQHVGVLRQFARSILTGEPLVARGEEGIFGLTLSNAMHLSSWLDQKIALPLDEDLFYAELQKRVAGSKRKTGGERVLDTKGTYGSK
ncbi:MAG: Gfo/Idh/MocA family oxidoreductase [Clostridia bacterium]